MKYEWKITLCRMKIRNNINDGKGKKCLKHTKTVKHFITKSKNSKIKLQTKKLFSLQHQTLNVLRKADKFKLKEKKSLKKENLFLKRKLFNDDTQALKKLKQSNLENFKSNVLESDNSKNVNIIVETSEHFHNSYDTANVTNCQNEVNRKKKHKHKVCGKTKNELQQKFSSNKNMEDGINLPCSSSNLLQPSVSKLSINKNELTGFSYNCDEASNEDNCINEHNDTYNKEREQLFNNKNSGIDFYQFNKNHVLLSLMHPFSLYLIGVLEIEVLVGSINVLGYTIDRLSGKQILYSPRGVGHLCITTKEKGEVDDISLQHILGFGISEEKVNSITTKFNNNFVMLILNKERGDISSIIWPKFVERYSEQILLPSLYSGNEIENVLQSTFQVHSQNTKLYREMLEWNNILTHVKGGSRTILCGGSGVGKSTLLRYLVNRSLSSWDKVLVIDFDPGQSEFTVPGCVSAFLINTPLLGPNFTHNSNPLRSFFYGSVDVIHNLKFYFICIQNVIDYCNSQEELKNIPWFINTIGYNKGMGVLIVSSMIKKVSPTVLVQIESQHKARNFPALLDPEFVEDNILNLCRSEHDPKVLNYELLPIPSAVENIGFYKKNKKKQQAQTWGLSAPSLRNIMILSYFGQMLNSKVKDIFYVEPYRYCKRCEERD
ncbi:polynucleotide 5'-hydroxyl-kinase NOL9-like isoform X4 [Lycorma delicatula]|uniref:polynucleotide 5'-hydroxyl-kinase NOL9-like isoform X4 n=1 Tax=Lycorma delicatula TaxID=130591 RepID=UPI003F50D54C